MIDPNRVTEIYAACLVDDVDDGIDAVDVEGIVHTSRFSEAKLLDHATEIGTMLNQMQDTFKSVEQGGGGGWSFLNICEDRDGNLWTGVHWTCEMLIQLGIGTGQAQWLGPRELWKAFPGGVPYVMVTPAGTEERS